MNWLGKIGVTLFLLGWLCFFGLFIGALLLSPEYVYQILLVGFFIGCITGFILMVISVLYDRYKQLETEEVRPKV